MFLLCPRVLPNTCSDASPAGKSHIGKDPGIYTLRRGPAKAVTSDNPAAGEKFCCPHGKFDPNTEQGNKYGDAELALDAVPASDYGFPASNPAEAPNGAKGELCKGIS